MAKALSSIFTGILPGFLTGGGGSKSDSAPVALPPLPTREAATTEATKAVDARRRRAGRAGTILTDSNLTSTNPTVTRPTLGA